MIQHVFHVRGDDGPVAQVMYDETSGEETTAYLARDGLGSVGVVFDKNGTVLERLYHEPFGRRSGADGAALPGFSFTSDVSIGFTGHQHDDDLDLIDMNGRVYDPVQKRFLTPDPIVSNPFFNQSYNRYAYVLNNPLRYTDPTGFDSEPASGNASTAQLGADDPRRLRLPERPAPSGTTVSCAEVKCGGTPSSDSRGQTSPSGATAAPRSSAGATPSAGLSAAPPATPKVVKPPTVAPPPFVAPTAGVTSQPDNLTDYVVRHGNRASDGVATAASGLLAVATLGPGWYWGQAATAGGQQVIDGVVDDDPKKIFDGAVTLVETALEITKADQAIADALESLGDDAPPEPPGGSRLSRGPTTLKPGPYAKESIPAHEGKPSAEEQRRVNGLMEKHGCHTCGTRNPGTKSGNAIADHQPPQALGEPRQFFPHCNGCKARQGGEVVQELRRQQKR